MPHSLTIASVSFHSYGVKRSGARLRELNYLIYIVRTDLHLGFEVDAREDVVVHVVRGGAGGGRRHRVAGARTSRLRGRDEVS